MEITVGVTGGTAMTIQRIRHHVRRPEGDHEIAWVVHVYQSVEQSNWCMTQLRRHYPGSRVVMITDGDGSDYTQVARSHKCELVVGEHLMTLTRCHEYITRLLTAVTGCGATYVFKIDPDTKIWRRFTELPAFSSMFGTLETISEGLRDEILLPANVQGGCIGMTQDAALDILQSGIVNYENCVVKALETWARCADMVRSVARGRFCDDFLLSWAAHQLCIPIVEARDIRSRWRRTAPNPDGRYAVTHPHKHEYEKVRP